MSILKIDPSLLSTAGASDGQVLAYNASTNRIEFSAGGGGGGGVTVYANNDVLPNTGVSIGSQAYVESTDRLYLWTVNNSWQRINSVNTPPTAITNYLGAYYLASNGAPTVLSLVSSDPELLPLTWSYEVANGTLGNTTVTQSANVFTVTPSTNSADEGSFTLTFSANDGVYATSANVIFNLSLQEGWNVANAVLVGTANLSYSVATQEATPYGIQFSANGLAMYVTGTSGDDINLYTLAAPWNLDSTTFVASYPYTANATANNFTNPYCLQFSPDGANLYVAGLTISGGIADTQIVQFALATPNEVSTISTTANSLGAFSVAGQETAPTDVFFRDDGSRMYVIGSTGDDVNEYQLSRPWDPSSAVFTTTFLVSAKEVAPQGIYFTPSGNAFYIVGSGSDSVHRYDMSTAWSINSASFTSTFSVATQELTPNAVEFKPDGSRMYVLGSTGDDFNEYSLSTPWDITTASYVRVQGQSQATIPTSMRFSSDGANLYMTGTAYDIHYYTLSEAWNVATLSFQYTWTPMYGSGADLQGIYFDSTGQYLYLANNTGDRVIPLYLRTPWDVSSASLPSRLIDNNRFTGINYFRLNSDGSKIYITGQNHDSILEYSLSESWNVWSATYSNTFSLSADTTTPTGIDISSDDSTLRIADGSRFYSYPMSTPSDLTSVYRPQTINLTDTAVQDLYFKPDGSKFYVVGSTLDQVTQYDLSVPWDLDTASLSSNVSVSAQESAPYSITFNGDGTSLYLIGNSKYLSEFTLSTPWDISSASYTRQLSLGQIFNTNIFWVDFSPDGTKFYMSPDSLYLETYYLSTPYDITSAYKKTSYYASFIPAYITGAVFNDTGTEAYIIERNSSTPKIWKLSLLVPWDFSSSYLEVDYSIPTSSVGSTESRGMALSADGKYVFIVSQSGATLTRFELQNSYDIATIKHPYISQIINYAAAAVDYYDVLFQSNNSLLFTVNNATDTVLRLPVTSQNNNFTFGSNAATWYRTAGTQSTIGTTAIESLKFKPDGTKAYTIDTGSDTIFEFSFSVPWDVSTLSLTSEKLFSAPESGPTGIEFSSAGDYLYVVGGALDTVYQYKLNVPWSLQLPVLIASYSIGAQEATPQAIVFSEDGSYMYVMGSSGDDINQYTLSTPWDITTSSFTRVQSISAQESIPYNLAFRPDGTRLYVRGGNNRRVYEYALSTPWDVSSLSFTRQLQLPSSWSINGGIALNPSGTRLYVGDGTNQMIREYVLGS
jgi:6-phosphogluconolactonase (cycloisomerase 2 family)